MLLFSNMQRCFMKAANFTASREIKDSCTIHKGYILNISSKKANVIIHGWDKPMISIRIRISFENANIKTAEKELEYAKYNILKTAEGVNLNNYFSLPSNVNKISSTVTGGLHNFYAQSPEYHCKQRLWKL